MHTVFSFDLESGSEPKRKEVEAKLEYLRFVRVTEVSTLWLHHSSIKPLPEVADIILDEVEKLGARLEGIFISRGDQLLKTKHPHSGLSRFIRQWPAASEREGAANKSLVDVIMETINPPQL